MRGNIYHSTAGNHEPLGTQENHNVKVFSGAATDSC